MAFWGYGASHKNVSIPDRDLGFFRPPVPEALLYLVFKVQFRESKTKVPFQPSTCQYPNFHIHPKALSCNTFPLSVNHFFRQRASNSYSTYIVAPKFNTSILTPTHSRIFHPKTHINRITTCPKPPKQYPKPPPKSPPNQPRRSPPPQAPTAPAPQR